MRVYVDASETKSWHCQPSIPNISQRLLTRMIWSRPAMTTTENPFSSSLPLPSASFLLETCSIRNPSGQSTNPSRQADSTLSIRIWQYKTTLVYPGAFSENNPDQPSTFQRALRTDDSGYRYWLINNRPFAWHIVVARWFLPSTCAVPQLWTTAPSSPRNPCSSSLIRRINKLPSSPQVGWTTYILHKP